MRYESEDRQFDSRWCHWNFSLTKSFLPHYGPGIESASNRNEYQEYFLGVNAAGAWGRQPYHIHVPTVLKSGGPQTPGTIWVCPGLQWDGCTFILQAVGNNGARDYCYSSCRNKEHRNENKVKCSVQDSVD